MKRWTLALAAAVLFAVCPIASPAQVAATPGTPGITVVATGSAPVRDWVEEIEIRYAPVAQGDAAFAACTAAIAGLDAAVRALGLPSATVTASVTRYESPAGNPPTPIAIAQLRVTAAQTGRLLAAMQKAGWRASPPQLEPSDPQAAHDAAYAAAVVDARRRAEAIAAADGRHVGKLVSVQPSVTDYFSTLMSSLGSLASVLNRGGFAPPANSTITQTGSFTFELLP
jgi:uncharacterized protein YggE